MTILMIKMAMSGYGQDMRIEVLRSGVKGYRNMEEKEDRGERKNM